MKKCPYCGHENDDAAWKCDKCQAGFPSETNKTEEKPVKAKRTKRSE